VTHFESFLFGALLTCATGSAVAQTGSGLVLAETIESNRRELIEFRRDLHQHPEISGQEIRTAEKIAEHLNALDFEVTTGVGGHGVIGILRGPSPGPMVAFRADMDAVPSRAPDPVDFPSLTPGVRHICGHDLHVTIGLALADGFAAIKSSLTGSVMLVFQPAEERATGAKAMIQDGVFFGHRPDAIYALHTAPMNVGVLATARRALMAGRDRVRVTINGDGDLREIGNEVRRILMSISTLTSAQSARPQPPEAVFGQIGPPRRAGSGYVVSGMYTTGSAPARAFAQNVLEQQIGALNSDGMTVEMVYQPLVMAGVTNDPVLVDSANVVARSVRGVEDVILTETITPMFSEDFGTFQAEVPGVMYFLGVSNEEKGWVGMPHTPNYVADEEAIFLGARVMGAVMLDRLGWR
jgi:metal-dependent amidase/aminoacylase/carboxypeptidase family protein